MTLMRHFRLLTTLTLFSATWIAGAGDFALGSEGAGGAVPGFHRLNGVLIPNEPYREGQPRATGLQQPWPSMISLERNPMTPEKVELGKLLFFDPIMSGDNTISCAHCHHPDFGFADGRRLGMGAGGRDYGPPRHGGAELGRHVPTLWNAAYNRSQYWDGRAEDLEAQALGPITTREEMNQPKEGLVEELKGNPEYVRLFTAAFNGKPEEAVTFDNVILAIGAFERTLLAFNSKFDRYAAGDFSVLDSHEKNGMKVFRSLKTRCFECHTFPTFTDGSFRVLGVPEDGKTDLGRGGVSPQGPDRGFKVPTLRNIALTAPYMHNGHFGNLEDVIDFYRKGAGHAEPNPVPGTDQKLEVYSITGEERDDLIAFMRALTDTSLQPDPPERVPSGLRVVPVRTPRRASNATPDSPVANAQIRQAPRSLIGAEESLIAAARGDSPLSRLRGVVGSTPSGRPASFEPPPGTVLVSSGSPKALTATFHVWPGQSIQEGIERARPGDLVKVYPGTYHESLKVEREGIRLLGVEVEGQRPVLDGAGDLEMAIEAKSPGLKVEGFTIRRFKASGPAAIRAEGAELRNVTLE